MPRFPGPLSAPIEAWQGEALGVRLGASLRLLYVHGLMTEAERDRIMRRLRAAFAREAKKAG